MASGTVVSTPGPDLREPYIQRVNDIGNDICAAWSPRPSLDCPGMFDLDIPRSDISLLKESLEEAGITCVDINPCRDSRTITLVQIVILYPRKLSTAFVFFLSRGGKPNGALEYQRSMICSHFIQGLPIMILIPRPNAIQGRVKLHAYTDSRV